MVLTVWLGVLSGWRFLGLLASLVVCAADLDVSCNYAILGFWWVAGWMF